VSFTHGEYLEPGVIEEAFKPQEPLPARHGIAPSQPNPNSSASAWKWAGLWGTALLFAFMVVSVTSANETVLDRTVRLDPDAVSGQPSAMSFSEPFQINSRGNVRVELFTTVSNDWLGVQGDLVNQETGEVRSFYEEVSYYSGRDSEGSWTEGSNTASTYLSAVSPGTYVLRTTAAFANPPRGPGMGRTFQVKLTSDTPRALWFCFALVLLLVGPLLAFMRSSSFESTRWAESNLSDS
jgi:hypothetical protein